MAQKLYTKEMFLIAAEKCEVSMIDANHIMKYIDEYVTPIELPSDEDIESRYNKFIDTEIQLGFLKQEQGERLKWYYKTYFIDKIQGGNK